MPYLRFYIDISQTAPLADQTWLMASPTPSGVLSPGMRRYSFEVLLPTPECEKAKQLPSVKAQETSDD